MERQRDESLFGLLTSAVKAWDRFWFSAADPTTLAVIRILCGAITCYVHFCYSWDLLGYVGPHAWIDRDLVYYIRNEVPIYRYGLTWDETFQPFGQGNYFWSIYHHVEYAPYIILIHSSFVLAMLLFTLGLWTPYTGLYSWLGAMCYVQRATSTVFGLDTMMMITLLYLQFGPSGAALSLDRWLVERDARRRGVPVPPIEPSQAANFAIRMIQAHFAWIYFASGTSKLLGNTWWAGTAVDLVVLNPAFAPMDWSGYYNLMVGLASSRWLWSIWTTTSIVGTLVLEIAFIFLVWDSRWTWFLVAGGICLHTGIGVLMGLSTFSLMMMVMLVSFVPPDVMKAVLDELSTWRNRPALKAA